MPIIEYTPEHFDDLQEMVERVPANMNLSHRPFVDYYYATRPWCKLYLYVSDSGKVVGTLGRELLRFEHQCGGEIREIRIRIGSNWFSLQPGVGGELTKFSAAANPNSFGMTLVVSRKALTVLQHYGWVPLPGVRGYFLNGPCTLYPGKAWWKSTWNAAVRMGGTRISKFAGRIAVDVTERISVCEERSYSKDLLPRRSPFIFRFAPTVEYLDWRYNLSLTFVRYRLFRILTRGGTIGYVILNEAQNHIMVAQCDGEDATALAYGILMAVVEAGSRDERPRTVFLSCCNAEMGRVFEQFGFRMKPWGGDLPFAFHTVPPQLNVSGTGTAKWLVNYDWCDNGLQAPFLDQDRCGDLRRGRAPTGNI